MRRSDWSFVAGSLSSSSLRKRLFSALICLFLGFAAFTPAVRAQTASTGAVTGIVTDGTGGTMTGASLRVISQATGEVRTVVTGANGIYFVAALPPGPYTLNVSKDGFKSLTVASLQIIVTETATLNLRLEVGAVAERVTVEATAEQLQTESSTLGRVTSGEQVLSLPLVTRNYTQIISLNPGVAADVNDAGALGRGAMGNGGAPIVSNGGTINDNNVQMNGAARRER